MPAGPSAPARETIKPSSGCAAFDITHASVQKYDRNRVCARLFPSSFFLPSTDQRGRPSQLINERTRPQKYYMGRQDTSARSKRPAIGRVSPPRELSPLNALRLSMLSNQTDLISGYLPPPPPPDSLVPVTAEGSGVERSGWIRLGEGLK